jgi:hypothetical protein
MAGGRTPHVVSSIMSVRGTVLQRQSSIRIAHVLPIHHNRFSGIQSGPPCLDLYTEYATTVESLTTLGFLAAARLDCILVKVSVQDLG